MQEIVITVRMRVECRVARKSARGTDKKESPDDPPACPIAEDT